MITPEPLRNNPFRFRKRRSLHSKLYGEDRSRPIRPIDNVSHYSGTQGRVSPKSYMSDFPEGYMPHPGFMQIPQSAYQPYDELQDMSMSDFGGTADEFRFAAMKLAGIKHPDEGVEYDDCLMTREFLQEQLESLGQEFPPDFDTNETASHILANHIQDENFDMEQNLLGNMIEIQMAVEQAKIESLAGVNTEPSDFGLAIPQDFFEQQIFETDFYEVQHAEFDYGAQMEADFSAQEAMFEQPVEEMGPMEDLGLQSLENIIEAEQMQEAAEDMDAMKPYPDQFQHDNDMIEQEMYDEQMLYMMDPFMMGDPFGPMPFGFGPGGGP